MFQLKFSNKFLSEEAERTQLNFKKKSGLKTTHRVEPVQELQA